MLLSNWLGSSPRCFALKAATLASCSAMLARASAKLAFKERQSCFRKAAAAHSRFRR